MAQDQKPEPIDAHTLRRQMARAETLMAETNSALSEALQQLRLDKPGASQAIRRQQAELTRLLRVSRSVERKHREWLSQTDDEGRKEDLNLARARDEVGRRLDRLRAQIGSRGLSK